VAAATVEEASIWCRTVVDRLSATRAFAHTSACAAVRQSASDCPAMRDHSTHATSPPASIATGVPMNTIPTLLEVGSPCEMARVQLAQRNPVDVPATSALPVADVKGSSRQMAMNQSEPCKTLFRSATHSATSADSPLQ
jgi:hypothetical protein